MFFVVAYWNVEKIQKNFHSAIFLRFCCVKLFCFFSSLLSLTNSLARVEKISLRSHNNTLYEDDNNDNNEKSSRHWSVTTFYFSLIFLILFYFIFFVVNFIRFFFLLCQIVLSKLYLSLVFSIQLDWLLINKLSYIEQASCCWCCCAFHRNYMIVISSKRKSSSTYTTTMERKILYLIDMINIGNWIT